MAYTNLLITLSYADLSVTFNNWKGDEPPRSRKTFVNESTYSISGNLVKSGTSFELPYTWAISSALYEADYDKVKAIWEIADYVRRNERTLTTVTANATTNTLNATAHAFQNGDVITLSTSNTLPAPLLTTLDYYVVNRATDTFQVALTFGGAAIDLTDTGTGTHQAKSQLYVRLDDQTEEIFERGKTSSTKTRSNVAGTTPRELNGGVYYFPRFLADWVSPAIFGRWGVSASTGAKVRSVSLILQDTGVKI